MKITNVITKCKNEHNAMITPTKRWDILNNHRFTAQYDAKIESGTNFFIATLGIIGCNTLFSCEGHPNGFYIMFEATYNQAMEIYERGFFDVYIHQYNTWVLRNKRRSKNKEETRDLLRCAAASWKNKWNIPTKQLLAEMKRRFKEVKL